MVLPPPPPWGSALPGAARRACVSDPPLRLLTAAICGPVADCVAPWAGETPDPDPRCQPSLNERSDQPPPGTGTQTAHPCPASASPAGDGPQRTFWKPGLAAGRPPEAQQGRRCGAGHLARADS